MKKCASCSKITKTKRVCQDCGRPLCFSCATQKRLCNSCFMIKNDKAIVSDYFKDKYLEKAKVVLPSMLFMFMMLLLLPSVSGYEADLTSFEYCFDNPWNTEKGSLDEYWTSYVDNLGCDVTSVELVVRHPVTYLVDECLPDTYNCVDDFTLTANGSVNNPECTLVKGKCSKVEKVVIEEYDLEKYDYLIPKESKICLKAKRKAQLGFQSCDMNFIYDDGVEVFDAADGGSLGLTAFEPAAWWNVSFNRKYSISANSTSDNNNLVPFRLIINDSYIDMQNCQADGGDVRIVNATEDGEEVYNITSWDGTTGIIFINASLNWTGYLYCNASTSLTTTSSNIDLLNESLFSYWTMDDDDTSGSTIYDRQGNNDGVGSGVTTSLDGVLKESWEIGTSDEIKLTNTGDLDYSCNSGECSFSAWINVSDITGAQNIINFDAAGDRGMYYQITSNGKLRFLCGTAAAANYRDSTNIVIKTDGWYHVVLVKYAVVNKFEMWVNGTNITWGGGANNIPSGPCTDGYINSETWLGNSGSGSSEGIKGVLDEVGFWNRPITPGEISRLYNTHGSKSYPLYAEPDYSFGVEESQVTTTNLDIGLYNEDYENISLVVSEGTDFFVWANMTFASNGSVVYPNSECNYTANEIFDEAYERNPGTNLSVCLSGCDSTNLSTTFTVKEDGFIYDLYRFRLCRNTASVADTFTISNNCSGSYTYDYNMIPLCNSGYVNLSIIDANCTTGTQQTLSISSTGNTLSKATVLVDSFRGVDRFHNHSGSMVWNNTLQVFLSEGVHEYYEHGSKLIYVDCYANVSGIQNQTGSSLNVTVENTPPFIFIDTIWYWLLSTPVSFTDGVSVKYPLQNTINITGGCSDDDLQSAGVYLNFSNGTNIYEATFLASGGIVPSSVNFSQGNFSTNLSFLDGIDSYVFQGWCNDTSNNITYSQKTFSAENDAPIVTWLNSSGNVNNVPKTFNWSCTDDELESTTSYLYINGTLNQTGGTGFIFNDSENTYEFNVSCADSFRNSTNASITVQYISVCVVELFGIERGSRYPDNEIPGNVNCSNSVSVTSCSYSINDFATQEISNCSDFTIEAERGWNRFNFTVNQGLATESSVQLNFWAKDYDASVFDFPVILFSILILIGLIMLSAYVKIGLFKVLVGLTIFLIGLQMIALLWWIAAFLMVAGVGVILYSIFGD